MPAALLKKQFESVLGGHLDWQSRPELEWVRSGIPEIDLPRGCLTEIFGPASSGRTALLHSILAEATGREEVCALVDADDAFDPATATTAGVRLDRLIWIRSSHNAEHALKAADLLIQGGGFGVVAMDLGDADAPVEVGRAGTLRLDGELAREAGAVLPGLRRDRGEGEAFGWLVERAHLPSIGITRPCSRAVLTANS